MRLIETPLPVAFIRIGRSRMFCAVGFELRLPGRGTIQRTHDHDFHQRHMVS